MKYYVLKIEFINQKTHIQEVMFIENDILDANEHILFGQLENGYPYCVLREDGVAWLYRGDTREQFGYSNNFVDSIDNIEILGDTMK